MSLIRWILVLSMGGLLVAAVCVSLATATPSSGSTSTLLARGSFPGPLTIARHTDDGWETNVAAKPGLDVATQAITFQPGGHSGWHTHPGPVFITVVSGTMTFYESTDPACKPIIRTAGQGYLDEGEHAHLARNETGSPAVNLVTYLAPPGATLRIDQPEPPNCAFLSDQPPAPSGLTFGVVGRNVTVQWNASPRALDYILDVANTAGGVTLYSASVGPVTSVSTIAPPGRYYVRVRARNTSGTSAPSPEIVIDVPM
jgi:cupin domain